MGFHPEIGKLPYIVREERCDFANGDDLPRETVNGSTGQRILGWSMTLCSRYCI